MAHAKLVCSECGAELSVVDAICPGCGAAIERMPAKSRADRTHGSRTVPVSVPGTKGARGRFEPWQIVAGLAVLGLIAFFVYTELRREHVDARPAPVQQTQPPPAAQAPRVDIGPLEQAVAANPKDAAAMLRLANGLQDNRAFARAADAYERYLAIEPDDLDARVDMGVCYFELGRADSAGGEAMLRTALKEMERVAKKRPDHQPAAFNLGIVYLTMGDLGASNMWFKRAVEVNPSTELGARAKRILEQHSVTQ
jgi:tetratricopeptide (TPR) repeat protein/predicted RNA-binding Zn-ribbon protein involved in translation (DUF1610 family)